MKVPVTGATGFVGRALLNEFHGRGIVTCSAVRSGAGTVASGHTAVGDIGPEINWASALSSVDSVVHLAARVHVRSDNDLGSELFRKVNTFGTVALVQAAVRAGVRRFVFVSTVKVNGEAAQGRPFRASDKPNPVDAYARSKLEGERALATAAGIERVVVRPPLGVSDGVQRRGLADRVALPGRFPLERMLSFFASADALFVSLKAEPIFAMTIPGEVQSDLAAGKPLIGMLDGEGADLIVRHEAGLVCCAGDSAGFADIVARMADMLGSEQAAMAERARRLSADEFDRDLPIGQLERWLEELRT